MTFDTASMVQIVDRIHQLTDLVKLVPGIGDGSWLFCNTLFRICQWKSAWAINC